MKYRFLCLLTLLAVPLSAAELPWLTAGLQKFLTSSNLVALGWSKDGKVALIAPVDGGGRGGPAARLLLLDAVEDEVIADEELWPDEFEEDRDDALVRAMAASGRAQDFLEHCLDSGLIPLDGAARDLKSFPLAYQGSSVTARAVITSKSDESDEDVWGGRDLDYRIVVTSSTRGQKTVSSAKLTHVFEVKTDGYFLSPWEPRALVVSWYSQPGFEGEQPRTYVFSGCHLTLGYKK